MRFVWVTEVSVPTNIIIIVDFFDSLGEAKRTQSPAVRHCITQHRDETQLDTRNHGQS
jgi:hypothetical protein